MNAQKEVELIGSSINSTEFFSPLIIQTYFDIFLRFALFITLLYVYFIFAIYIFLNILKILRFFAYSFHFVMFLILILQFTQILSFENVSTVKVASIFSGAISDVMRLLSSSEVKRTLFVSSRTSCFFGICGIFSISLNYTILCF